MQQLSRYFFSVVLTISSFTLSAQQAIPDTCPEDLVLNAWSDLKFSTQKNSFISSRTLHTQGEIIVESGFNATITASQVIHFLPGFSARPGSRLSAYINPAACKETVNPVSKRGVTIGSCLFPNPGNGIFYISIPQPYTGVKYDLSVMTLEGKVVEKSSGRTSPLISLDLTGMAKGMYLVKLQYLASGKTEIFKVILQ